MSVRYTAILAFGREFKSKGDIEDFLEEHGYDPQEEWPNGLECIYLDRLNGNDPILGWEIIVDAGVPELQKEWQEMFPNSEPADAILAVQVS